MKKPMSYPKKGGFASAVKGGTTKMFGKGHAEPAKPGCTAPVRGSSSSSSSSSSY